MLFDDLVLSKSPEAYYKFDENVAGSSYGDSSPNNFDILASYQTADIVTGIASWSPYARKSLFGIPTPNTLSNVLDFSLEFNVKLPSVGAYTFADITTDAGVEVRAEVSESPTTSGEWLIKFGFGVGTWDINTPDTHQHAFVYSTDLSASLFDNDWHHIIVSWSGTSGSPWDTSAMSIYVDAYDVTDSSTAHSYGTTPESTAPLNFAGPLYITGPQTGGSSDLASFDNFAIYKQSFVPSEVVEHYNAIATIETSLEYDSTTEILKFTDGFLETVYETDSTYGLSLPLFGITFEATSEVTAVRATDDFLASRSKLTPEGSRTFSLQGTTLEALEPGISGSGITGTRWYEIPFDPNDINTAIISLTSSSGSVAKINVYKQPSLMNYTDYDDIDEDSEDDEDALIEPGASPSFSQMQLVISGTGSVKFTLDQTYYGPYFIQVGLYSGTGVGMSMEWGSADSYTGGTFADPEVLPEGDAGVSDTITTENAWLETGEPAGSSDVTATRSIWFQWTSPASLPTDPYTFTISGGGGSPFEAGIYTGTAVNALTQVASDASLGGPLTFTLAPTASTVYYFRIGTTADGVLFRINWNLPIEELPPADPVQHLVITVHAGVVGAEYGGVTYAPNQKITELPNRLSAQFQETLNVPGTGSIAVSIHDPVMLAYASPGWGKRPDEDQTAYANPGTVHAVAAGSQTVTWIDSLHSSVSGGDTILLGNPGTSTAEWITVKSRNNTTKTLTLTSKLHFAHGEGTQLNAIPHPEDDPFRLLKVGNFVKFWLDGKCVSGFIIKERESVIVDGGEESARAITVSGPTIHYLLNDFVVKHDNPSRVREHTSDTREFSWTSPVTTTDLWQNGGWFDTTGNYSTNVEAFNHPTKINSMKNPPGYHGKGGKNQAAKKRPKYALFALKTKKKKKKKKATTAFPDHGAQWMWMDRASALALSPKLITDNYTNHYYRAKVMKNIPAGTYRIAAHSDAQYWIYVNGNLVLSGGGNETYTDFKTVKFRINYGDNTNNENTVCVFVGDRTNTRKTKKKGKKKKVNNNVTSKVDYDHNDAFIMTMQLLNSKGKVAKTVLSSGNSNWWAYHGAKAPTWGRAAILWTLLREAKERGNESATLIYNATNAVKPDFAHKNENGGQWWDLKDFDTSLQIGTSVLDVQAQFSEIARFDVWVDPDTLRLWAWQGGTNGSLPRGTNKSHNVALVPGLNLIGYSVSEQDNIKNNLVIKYGDNGYTEVEQDLDFYYNYGSREGYIEFGGLHDVGSAEDLAEAILDSRSDTSKLSGAGDIVGHINESYSGSLISVKGAIPFRDFEVGDTISAPALNGLLRPHRVLSLTCTEDSEGVLTFEPELEGQ